MTHGSEPVKCFRCKRKGRVRYRATLLLAVFSLGISALLDKSETYRCPACHGKGYIR